MTKPEGSARRIRHSSFGLRSSFVPALRDHSSFGFAAFTIIELLIVMAIIIVLAGLILATAGYVQKKGQRSRAEAEIAAISAALENYKADNGVYPRNDDTDTLDAHVHQNPDPTKGDPEYLRASAYLFTQLNGTDVTQAPTSGAKNYFMFKPALLGGTTQGAGTVSYLRDPFGNSYGYSTANQSSATKGYNPTFDLWCTGGLASSSPTPTPNPLPTPQVLWIKNW